MTNPKRKLSKRAARQSPLLLFVLFVFIALMTVLTLEYLDYRQGKYSLIFTRIIKLKGFSVDQRHFNHDLLRMLDGAHVDFNWFYDRQGTYHFKIDTPADQFTRLMAKLEKMLPRFSGRLELTESHRLQDRTLYLYKTYLDKRLSHLLLVEKTPGEKAAPPENVEERAPREITVPTVVPIAKIAFIIDDIGYRDRVVDELASLHIPLTVSVIPDAPFARSEARKIQELKLEALIHLPMESKNSTNHTAAEEWISSRSSLEDISRMLKKARAVIPWARGVNNHMGSLITSRPELIVKVLQAIKQENLFFIDSRTTSESVAYEMAKGMKIKTLFRDVFLDDRQDYNRSREQINSLVNLARKNGQAVAIGHPFPSTLAAIRDAIASGDLATDQRVAIVFASTLLE